MSRSLEMWMLLLAVGMFILFLVLKSRGVFAGSSGEQHALRRALLEAKQRARRAVVPAESARAWREASRIALEGLERPALAAKLALRAERAEPSNAEGLQALSSSLRRASRYHALETLLWRRLASSGDALDHRALEELVNLYEGPIKRPERAQVLKRLTDRERRTG